MLILLISLVLNVAIETGCPSMCVTGEMINRRTLVNNVIDDDTTIKSMNTDPSSIINMNFGTKNSTIIFAQSGSTALLPCVAYNIGEGTVSWIRRKNIQHQLLTVGLTTYASDERFQAKHFHHSEDWTLQIKYVQSRDAGMYECQVSTHPPTSIFLFLEVVEARAEIVGPPEKYVRPGSTLQLHCMIKKSTETPSYLFWYHNYRMINYDIDQGVNVSTDLIARESWLEVPKASTRHSGNYTCEPSNASPASTVIYIFNGENPAARHSFNHATIYYKKSKIFIIVIFIILLQIIQL